MTYDLIAQCIRSGQCSAAQVAAHMQDRVFAAWYAKRYSYQI